MRMIFKWNEFTVFMFSPVQHHKTIVNRRHAGDLSASTILMSKYFFFSHVFKLSYSEYSCLVFGSMNFNRCIDSCNHHDNQNSVPLTYCPFVSNLAPLLALATTVV